MTDRATHNHDREDLAEACRRVTRRVPRMAAACNRSLRPPLNAEDLADASQAASAAILAQGARFRGECMLETWAFAIVRTTVIGHAAARRRARDRQTPLSDPAAVRAPTTTLTPGTWVGRAVQLALARVADVDQEIIRLRFERGLPFWAIGEELELPESTVKTRFHRLLPRLRARLRSVWQVWKE